MSEHFDQNGSITIVLNKTEFKEETVLSVKLKSRHVERLKYKLIIVYFPNINDVSSISGWKCSCPVGGRKVGCCSHIACIIFYLSFGKYEDILEKPGYSLNGILLKMGISSDENEDSENDNNDDDRNIEKADHEDNDYKHPKMANLLLLTKLQIISILQAHVNKKLKEKYRQALP